VEKIPAPGLVELIEAGKADGPETEELLRRLLAGHVGRLDALVLGCTHYPFAEEAIRRVLGESTLLLDGGDGTARETRRRLEIAGLLATDGHGELILRSSRNDDELRALARQYI